MVVGRADPKKTDPIHRLADKRLHGCETSGGDADALVNQFSVSGCEAHAEVSKAAISCANKVNSNNESDISCGTEHQEG